MATIIKVNGQTITIANKSSEAFDYDKAFSSIESFGSSIEKDIATLNVISNNKAMEAFGYKSTEGVGQAIADTAKKIWQKIKEWLGKLWKFIQKIGTFFKEKLFSRKPNMGFVKKIAERFKKKSPEAAETLNKEEQNVAENYQKMDKMNNLLNSTFSGMVTSVEKIAATKEAIIDESAAEVEESHKKLQDVVDKISEIKENVTQNTIAVASKLIPDNIIDVTYRVLDSTNKEIKTGTEMVSKCENSGNKIAASMASKTTQAVSAVTGASKEVVATISAYIASVDSLVKKESKGEVSIYDIKTDEDFRKFMESGDTLVL